LTATLATKGYLTVIYSGMVLSLDIAKALDILGVLVCQLGAAGGINAST
jgi:hypothetical protein